jgi:hemoglobin
LTERLSLYSQLGEDLVTQVITEFYHRAFRDMMIGHFFIGKDQNELTAKQIAFARGMLGGPRLYQGKNLREAHAPLPIRPPHFGRRKVIMQEVLSDLSVPEHLASAWLKLEDDLRPIILNSRTQSPLPSER